MLVYACKFIEKNVQEDSFESGCDPTTQTCVMHEQVNITGETLKELLEKIQNTYALKFDSLFVREDGSFSFNRQEDAEGNEPSDQDQKKFKDGQIKLYLADYDFCLERREVTQVSVDEYKTTGIATHD